MVMVSRADELERLEYQSWTVLDLSPIYQVLTENEYKHENKALRKDIEKKTF